MISEVLEGSRWRFTFSEPEAYFIISIMARLAGHYREDVSQLPPAQRDFWLGKGSLPPGTLPPAGAANEELASAEELLAESRLELRPERLNLAENWVREFETAEKHDPWSIELSASERDDFLAMVNDRRLLVALEHGITEVEMDADPGEIEDDARRAAIFEIYFLGRFIFSALGPQIYRPL
jgi:hypothetical protein